MADRLGTEGEIFFRTVNLWVKKCVCLYCVCVCVCVCVCACVRVRTRSLAYECVVNSMNSVSSRKKKKLALSLSN